MSLRPTSSQAEQRASMRRELLIRLLAPLATITMSYIPLEFVHEHDEDKNGIIHCMMMHPQHIIKVTTSQLGWNSIAAERVLDHTTSVPKPIHNLESVCIIRGSAKILPWMQFDFSEKITIQPTSYTVRHDGGNFQLYNWQFEGSNDAIAWTTIRRHVEDDTFPARAGVLHKIHTFHNLDQHDFYRYLRIQTTGYCFQNVDTFAIRCFEVYGNVAS